MHIDRIYSQHKAIQMSKGKKILGPCAKLTKYKYLAPAQNRLPNALVEKMEGGLNKFWVRKTI